MRSKHERSALGQPEPGVVLLCILIVTIAAACRGSDDRDVPKSDSGADAELLHDAEAAAADQVPHQPLTAEDLSLCFMDDTGQLMAGYLDLTADFRRETPKVQDPAGETGWWFVPGEADSREGLEYGPTAMSPYGGDTIRVLVSGRKMVLIAAMAAGPVTPRGIQVGSSEAEVIAAYGEPETRQQDGDGQSLIYTLPDERVYVERLVLSFNTHDGVVRSIRMFADFLPFDPPTPADFALVFPGGHIVEPLDPIADLVDAVPGILSPTASAEQGGPFEQWSGDGVAVGVLISEQTIDEITVSASGYATPRGITPGDTVDDLHLAYGPPPVPYDDGRFELYRSEGPFPPARGYGLEFVTDGETIESIRVYVD